MNVKELRNLINGMPDDAEVIIWVNDRDDPSDGEAVDVHQWHVSGVQGHNKDQTPAVHLTVLI